MECQSAAALNCDLIASSSHQAALAYSTSHLTTIDPSTATDPEIIGRLRLVTKRYASGNAAPTEVMNNPRLLASLLHPSELPPCFVVAGSQRATPPTKEKIGWTLRGTWKDCRGSYTAVRNGAGAVDVSSPAPCYVGVKRILQFQHPDGANSGWKMVLYHGLDSNSVIEDKVTFCKVFDLKGDGSISNNKMKFAAGKQPCRLGASSSPFPTILVPAAPVYLAPTFFDEFDEMMNDFNAEEHPIYGDMQMDDMYFPSLDDDTQILAGEGVQFTNYCLNGEEVVAVPDNGGRKQERKRSKAWEHFTMIRTRDHEDVYAACHLCDCMLKAHSVRDGTSALNRHYRNHLKP